MIDAVQVTIVRLSLSSGCQVTEIRYTWEEDGRAQYALTRVPWIIDGSPGNVARERQEFIRRRGADR